MGQKVRTQYKVAAVQAAPEFLHIEKGVQKAIALIEKAASDGCALIAFPEVWLPGYPWWIWLDSPAWGMQFVRSYFENAMEVGDENFERIRRAAALNGIHVVMGFTERAAGTLYISQAVFDDAGHVIATRRKLKPTHVERSVYGEGDGSHLAVHATGIGRLGALCCAEHLQPLTKYAMFSQHEQIHVASWPSFSVYRGGAYQLSAPANLAVSQIYALEGQCFVVAPCAIVSKDMIDLMVDTPGKVGLLLEGGGFAMIFGPDGSPMCEPVPETEEGLLYADIDLGNIGIAKAAYDPVGHYSRPDVLRLLFNKEPAMRVQSLAGHTKAEQAVLPRQDGLPTVGRQESVDGFHPLGHQSQADAEHSTAAIAAQ